MPSQATPQASQLPSSQTYPQGQFSNQNRPNVNTHKLVDHKLLDQRIRAIRGFSAYGMDVKELCLVPNVVLPQNFKVPSLQKYNRVRCPRSHITMYCRKMTSYIDNDALLIHCFQDSLSGVSLDWYMELKHSKI